MCPQPHPCSSGLFLAVRNVSELRNIVCTFFWLYVSSPFHCLFLKAARCLSELQEAGAAGTWALQGSASVLPSPLCLRLRRQVAVSLPAFQALRSVTSLRAFFVFSPLKGLPVALGRVEGPNCGLVVSALGHRLARGVCPLHPLAILMLHLLFTFVLLYIGL